jgi:pimeloyl-ACP methyl ester carboxylesterase
MTPELKHVESSDGATIACYVAGHGSPLVLVHGTSADHTRWAPVSAALEARTTTYAIDRRGRGASTDGREYTIESEFEDVAAVIDSIEGDVDVLGHSYGAICALEATLRTSGVRRLVLYEPPLPSASRSIRQGSSSGSTNPSPRETVRPSCRHSCARW